MSAEPYKVAAVLLDPAWEWGTISIDGVSHVHLTLIHPVHGRIASVIPKDVCKSISAGLSEMASK